jgi:protein-S-isoprenylcysteine O-methyltransferase Ste14
VTHSAGTTPPPKNGLTKYGIDGLIRHQMTPLVMAVPLFIGAGTLNWYWGWVFSVIYFLAWIGLNAALVRWNPELLNERGKHTKQLTGTKSWDWILLSLYGVVLIVQPFIAGLDYRNGWSAASAPIIYVAGNVLNILAVALLTWAMVANRFFEGTVRIQQQRGHYVISSGPYRYVRHPGYVAVVLTFVSLPLALGTWAALIPGAVGIGIYIVRTALEDRTLQTELPGYADYAQRTRFRLLPGIW